MQNVKISRAVLSVTDKSNLSEFAKFLSEGGCELVSTGGTMKAIAEAGVPVTSVSDVTGFPEIMGGRVKTLHPHIHAALLADKDTPEHLQVLANMRLAPIDLICVNLYDFERAVREKASDKAAVEQIDIGGPTMLRAAAKNYHSVLVVPGTEFYPRVMEALAENDFRAPLALRKELAAETFARVSAYDAMIAEYLGK